MNYLEFLKHFIERRGYEMILRNKNMPNFCVDLRKNRRVFHQMFCGISQIPSKPCEVMLLLLLLICSIYLWVTGYTRFGKVDVHTLIENFQKNSQVFNNFIYL